jgi:hypothetical protein
LSEGGEGEGGGADGEFVVNRILIGGCSRSGTTFLQGLLANHPKILTFPETGVFLKALGMRGRVLPWARLGLTLGKERKALRRLLRHLGRTLDEVPSIPSRRLLLGPALRDVADFFDAVARGAGKEIWLEKTPRHVLHAARIRRMVPDSLFIHLIRDGRDVVASIVDRALRFPGKFPRQADPSYGIRQWNRSLRATQLAMREPGHVVVFYQSLSEHPEATLRALCDVIGIEFNERMLVRSPEREFVTREEGWKASPPGPIGPSPSKFAHLFDETTQAEIDLELETGFFETVEERLSGTPGKIWVSGAES